jgi:PAT family beta-lactamase induction signal transducer AmpG
LHQKTTKQNKPAFLWVPSLYFAEGLPYVIVVNLSVILYNRLGISNTQMAFYTGWLYLPWVIKPLWSPVVELFKTKRWWIVAMQLFIGAALGAVALTLQLPSFFFYSLLFLWLMAFSSATHDIAADGFYLLGLDTNRQAKYVGIRSLFYRLAMIAGQGALVILAGNLEKRLGNIHLAWSIVIGVMSALFLVFVIYHYWMLPRLATDQPTPSSHGFWQGYGKTMGSFFKKPNIGLALAFILLFRLGESQLLKMTQPFLLGPSNTGGLALATEQVGWIYGTVGMVFLIAGGILGGLAIATKGLKYWIWWMVLAIHTPNLLYVYLAFFQPHNIYLIGSFVAIEQLGYGFGLTAFMMYMMQFADGPHKTTHYALATGFMALGMMVPGMLSGWLQSLMGYQWFFVWVCACTIPGVVAVMYLKVDEGVGRKKSA